MLIPRITTHPQAYNPTETFTYDSVGNRLTSHLSSDYVYDNLNKLLGDDGYTYSYDNNGNLTSKVDKVSSATTTYQYDAEDRLTQVVTPTDVIQYKYDGLGRRNVRILNGVVTRYVYDQEDILFEFDENDQIKARYTHGPGIDEPISVDRDTDGDGVLDVTYYYHKDGLGSITTITDTSGNVVQTYVYDTFGKIVQQTGSVENVYTYTGREWDAEAGLYYYRARYYDPTLGRFINGDPIGFAGGDVNFYVYVQNNPVNFVDPFGLITPDRIPNFGTATPLWPKKAYEWLDLECKEWLNVIDTYQKAVEAEKKLPPEEQKRLKEERAAMRRAGFGNLIIPSGIPVPPSGGVPQNYGNPNKRK